MYGPVFGTSSQNGKIPGPSRLTLACEVVSPPVAKAAVLMCCRHFQARAPNVPEVPVRRST